MLSWSCHESETEVDLVAVAAGRGDVGIPLGDELLRFATAAASLRGDATEMRDARDALVAIAGYTVMIDSAAVAANFHMMTRLADGTGARYPESRLSDMAPTISRMGATDMASRR
ncbi:MAG: hypothetical protein AB7Q42_22300 [Acidimicrobiia bacterium]